MRFESVMIMGMLLSLFSGCTILRSGESVGLPDKTIVLTFDDGPNPRDDVTRRILEVLEKHQVKASFCVVGKNVEESPNLVRLIHSQGHDLVNHSYSHSLPFTKSRNRMEKDISLCDDAIGEVIGCNSYQSAFYRPPMGVITPGFEKRLNNQGVQIVSVTFFIRDVTIGPTESDCYTEKMIRRFKKDRGGIVVIHESRYRNNPESENNYTSPTCGANRSWVPDAVDQLITELSKEGYHFCSFTEIRVTR